MRRRAPSTDGAARTPRFRRGFTLLEMCFVLFIIVLLLGVMTPAIESAFVEQAVRADSHQLSLMVKTAMIQSEEQHRAYVIDLTPQGMSLHPAAGTDAKDKEIDLTSSPNDKEAEENPQPEDIVVDYPINKANQLFMPDPDKPNGWLPVASTSWLFMPGELCPAPRVRLVRDNAWIELSFNALTGNVENETAYFP